MGIDSLKCATIIMRSFSLSSVFRSIYRDDLIPRKTVFVGYARSNLTTVDIRENITPYIEFHDDEQELFDDFMSQNVYVQGSYDKEEDFVNLLNTVQELERNSEVNNRLFYLALPPTVFETVTKLIHQKLISET